MQELEKAIEILDKLSFFGGQRAGRELWNEFKQCKPYTSKACFNETTNEFDLSEKDYTPFAEIIAWRPLPEPYRKDGD